MKKNIIIHIPHSSLKIPKIFYSELIIPKAKIKNENIFLSDYLVHKLLPKNIKNIIKFKYSRIFCDVERFSNPKLEVMNKYGMGVIYTKNHQGKKFIKPSKSYQTQVIKNYYKPHHEKVDKLTLKLLNKYSECLLIDFHSYSDEFVKKVLKLENTPDVCIGITKNYIDETLIEYTKKHFESFGYTTQINYPYEGTYIPNVVMKNKDTRLKSIMIEINKRTYLNNNFHLNKSKFKKLKKCIKNYIKNL